MPSVSSSTHTGLYGGGIRVWVHVSYDYMTAPNGYDVMLSWNPGEVNRSAFGALPAPTFTSADGVAVWANVDFANGQDFELKFTCASGFTGDTLFTGMAYKAGETTAAKSEATWSCE